MAITISKKIPKTSTLGAYSDLEGGGAGFTGTAITITLAGATNVTSNTTKRLIKIQISESASTQLANASDVGNNKVKDLRRIDDTIKVRGWIEDDSTKTAWDKAWQLRAMASSGGPLSSLILENITFSTSTAEAFLEEVQFIGYPQRTVGKALDENAGAGVARIEVDLTFYIGDER